MLLPSENGLWFLDETVQMHIAKLLTGYMPGDRTFAMCGVGEPGAGKGSRCAPRLRGRWAHFAEPSHSIADGAAIL